MTTFSLRRACGALMTTGAVLTAGVAAGVTGGCASTGPTHGPGPATFTLLNDSSANLDIEMVSLSGTPTLTVTPGGSATSSIEPATDTTEGVLGVVLIPTEPVSGAIGKPVRVNIDGEPYAIRVFGTSAALRWARLKPHRTDRSNDLTAPPPPNPGAGVQAR